MISKGQKCSTVDSDDYIVFPKGCFGCIPDDYVQICKSMSNKFSVHENGKGYCHVGTRQAGRCELQDEDKMTLYEIRYKGNWFDMGQAIHFKFPNIDVVL